jgi:hypothetical protein
MGISTTAAMVLPFLELVSYILSSIGGLAKSRSFAALRMAIHVGGH